MWSDDCFLMTLLTQTKGEKKKLEKIIASYNMANQWITQVYRNLTVVRWCNLDKVRLGCDPSSQGHIRKEIRQMTVGIEEKVDDDLLYQRTESLLSSFRCTCSCGLYG